MKVKINLTEQNRYLLREADITFDSKAESFDQLVRMISNYVRMGKTLCDEQDGQIHPVKFKCLYDSEERTLEICPASSCTLFCLFRVSSYTIEQAIGDFKVMCKENGIFVEDVSSLTSSTECEGLLQKHSLC